MEIWTKENVIQTVVEAELEAIKKKYWKAFEDMVLDRVVIALTLNQLTPHYCTFTEGRAYQLKEIKPQLPQIQRLISKMIRKAIDVYEEEDELLDRIVNVSEYIALENIEYVIEEYHAKQKKRIEISQIEAMVLNKLPHHYAATVKGRNRLKIELRANRPFRINLIRKAVQNILDVPRLGEPITETVRTSMIWKQEVKKPVINKLLGNRNGDFLHIR